MKKSNDSTLSIIGYFFKIAFQYRPSYVFLLLFQILLQAISPFSKIIFPTLIIEELTKVPLNQVNLSNLTWILVLFLAVEFIIPFLMNLNWMFLLHNENMLNKYWKKLMGDKMMQMRFYHLENPDVLDQISKAQDGLLGYGNNLGGFQALINNIISILSNFLSVIGIIYIIAQINIWLIFILIGIVGLRLWNQSQIKKLNIQQWEERKRMNRENEYYSSLLTDFKYGKDIRLYACKDLLITKNKEYIEDTYQYQIKINQKFKKLTIIDNLFNMINQLLTYGYVAYYFIQSYISIAQYSLYVTSINTFISSSYSIFNSFLNIRQNTKMMSEFKKFMEIDATYQEGNVKINPNDPIVLEFKDVSFAYPNTTEYVLRHINYRMEGQKKISIVGENGAGKSTFIKLLMRLYDPTEGEILLNGINIKEIPIQDYYALFSVVFQDYQLIGFNLGEQITSSDTFDEEKVLQILSEVQFNHKMENLQKGLATSMLKYFDDQGIELSGGESQKIAIARALFKDGKILILDEPTSALDPLAEYEIYSQFHKMTQGKLTFYISHRLSSCRFCDEIMVLEHGEIVQLGHHDKLILDEKGKYFEMFKAQAKYYQDDQVKHLLKGTKFFAK
ncbi:MAG TPA: ABC transporter ATP-binding protein [Candidatus Caccosoma faecigallinarum]|uniref:ABC transporter ATP-binding protein n=1 Tax=Candidatus Caccosoma faecigallinarum TaxID=2840720 RepID=A0A9D1K9U9_9FIRM|nr:ABC transporter ATP-binding protein [Candidatus Caccosoma faecigallinarum]